VPLGVNGKAYGGGEFGQVLAGFRFDRGPVAGRSGTPPGSLLAAAWPRSPSIGSSQIAGLISQTAAFLPVSCLD
jgi:hypothetical protein